MAAVLAVRLVVWQRQQQIPTAAARLQEEQLFFNSIPALKAPCAEDLQGSIFCKHLAALTYKWKRGTT